MLTFIFRCRDEDVIDVIFAVGTRPTQFCESCNWKRDNENVDLDPILRVQMDMPTRNGNLTEFLKNTFAEERIDGYVCGCGAKDTTLRKVKIEEPPQILILQLMRTTNHPQTGMQAKRIGPVHFGKYLDISDHVNQSGLKPVKYYLRGVIHHQHGDLLENPGGDELADANHGHYKVNVLGPNGWWRELEDLAVRPRISFERQKERDYNGTVLKKQKTTVKEPGGDWTPYVLIYERILTTRRR